MRYFFLKNYFFHLLKLQRQFRKLFLSLNNPFFKVRIEQARLQSFLAVAEELGIKGLAEENKQTEDTQCEPEPEQQEVECSGNDPESMRNKKSEQKSEVVK